MGRVWMYFLAVLNIALGFLILNRSTDRFGFDTYRSFLDRQEQERKKKKV